MGLGAGNWSEACARNAAASGRAGRSVGGSRGSVSKINDSAGQPISASPGQLDGRDAETFPPRKRGGILVRASDLNTRLVQFRDRVVKRSFHRLVPVLTLVLNFQLLTIEVEDKQANG